MDTSIPHPPRSLEHARALLKEAGFSWSTAPNGDPVLLDSEGKPVEFSILTSSSNADRTKMATLIQDDLKQLGMHVQVVPLEFRSLIDRVHQTKEYDACVLGLASFDADPNSDLNVWLSSGGTHLWDPSQSHPATPWEAEIDRLMEQQLSTPGYEQRKELYDRVQEILAENQPMIFLASPDILVGAKNSHRQIFILPFSNPTCSGMSSNSISAAARRVPADDPVLTKAAKKSPRAWNDERLVKECLAGNEEAWSLLIEKYKALIYSIPVKYRLPPHEAADVFQATCVELLHRLPDLREPKRSPNGSCRLLTTSATAGSSNSNVSSVATPTTDLPVPETPAIAESLVHQTQEEQMLREAMAALSPQCRRIGRTPFL